MTNPSEKPSTRALVPGLRNAWLQRAIDWVFFVPICGSVMLCLKWVLGIRIENRDAWRAQYKRLTDDRRPLIICCNHLTYMDPIILIYAFGHHIWYFFHFRRLPWNLAGANYKSNPVFRFIFFFSKCIYIDREGAKTHKREVLGVSSALLRHGEILSLFPEGRRSKTGRFDETRLAYGVGKLASQLPECRILCVYLRSHGQLKPSSFPKRGSVFRLMAEVIDYRAGPGADATKATETLTHEVANRLKRMEAAFFNEPIPSNADLRHVGERLLPG